jgi:fido (protein-threonine AMPylation protein)
MDKRSIAGSRYSGENKGAAGKDFKAESAEIQALLDDFGLTTDAPDVVLETMKHRYNMLDNLYESLNDALVKLSPQDWVKWSLAIHSFLYSDIMSFTGSFRKVEDKQGGMVYFGGIDGRTNQNKFKGANPSEIETELLKAFEYLSAKNPDNPAENAIRFYVEWSAIHPFYDANGRIGRILLHLYLTQHHLQVNWERIDQKHGKFMHKINACLDRRAGHKDAFNRQFTHLNTFWKGCIEVLESDDIQEPQ